MEPARRLRLSARARPFGEAVVEGGAGPEVQVTVVATLPLVGLLGVPAGMEVTAHAPRESFD